MSLMKSFHKLAVNRTTGEAYDFLVTNLLLNDFLIQSFTYEEHKRKLEPTLTNDGCREGKMRRLEAVSPATCTLPRRSSRIRDTNNEKQFIVSSSQTLQQLKLEVCIFSMNITSCKKSYY